MSKFKKVSRVLLEADGVMFFHCPGCDIVHGVNITRGDRPKWSWNGNVNSPTFSPSVLVAYRWGEKQEEMVCHSFVTDGKIQYLNDCTHSFAGKTIEMVDHDE